MGVLIHKLKKMKKITFTTMICLCIVLSCNGIPPKVRDAFTYCHINKYTGIDTVINVKGYYGRSIFYDNGLVFRNIGDYNSKRHKNNEEKNIPLFLQEVAENAETKDSKFFYDVINCGTYILCGDTIKIQSIHKSYSLNDYWRGSEEWFKIIDRNTLVCIESMPLSMDKSDWQGYEYYKANRGEEFKRPIIFVPVPIKPNPDYAWILKEKWFWCNEKDWKNYMERMKGKKK
jgi:hypothetical protein